MNRGILIGMVTLAVMLGALVPDRLCCGFAHRVGLL